MMMMMYEKRTCFEVEIGSEFAQAYIRIEDNVKSNLLPHILKNFN